MGENVKFFDIVDELRRAELPPLQRWVARGLSGLNALAANKPSLLRAGATVTCFNEAAPRGTKPRDRRSRGTGITRRVDRATDAGRAPV